MISALVAAVLTLTPASPPEIALTGAASAVPRATSELQTQPARTAKERLVNKASDEQRVNDCKVPVALRGPKVRPDACRVGAGTAPTR